MGKDHASILPRTVAVAIPYRLREGVDPTIGALRRGDVSVCLVSSRKHPGDWVLPKGGVEKGETSLAAAIRELFEEAGLVASEQVKPVSTTPQDRMTASDHKPHKHSRAANPDDPAFIPRANYVGHQVGVDATRGQLNEWLEKDERERQWFSPDEALQRIAWRRDIASILGAWIEGIPP